MDVLHLLNSVYAEITKNGKKLKVTETFQTVKSEKVEWVTNLHHFTLLVLAYLQKCKLTFTTGDWLC